jgi:hypothetical protein
MANVIKIKRSTVAGRVPLAADLQVGEVAVNTADGILYTKHADGAVKRVSGARLIAANAQPTGQTSGDFWYNTLTEILYVYVDTGFAQTYVDISTLNTGYTGSVGATGPQGVQGAVGYTGSLGAIGATGATGATGAQGTTGFVGSQGATGATGPAGATGVTGATGATGASGVQGLEGYTGSAGPLGYTGSAGLLDWIVISANRTAANRERLIVDSAGGSFTLTLPANPTVGTYVQVTDGANLALNTVTVNRNGSTIENSPNNLILDVPSATFEFIYTGATWQVTSTSGPKGDSGYTGSASTVAGYAGSRGDLGYSGSIGDIGYTGSAGPQGNLGATGATGLQGNVGATGPQGNTGATGATGPAGATGVTGFVGSQGATGSQGASLTIKGSVSTVAALPSSGNVQNDAYIVEADGDLYVWNGTAWSSVGQIVGPTGPQGPQGTTGYAGSQGLQGLQGDVGATGAQGNTGATGATGVAGATGATGITGATGATGAQGNSGYTGSAGTDGYLGSTGATGATGATGPQGAQGNSGYTGSTGDAGSVGYSGSVGFTGSQGNIGATGYTGSAGLLDWAVITSAHTAANRERLIIDTSGGSFSLTLPATPATGTYIQFTDGADLLTNPLTVVRNGSTIEGLSADLVMDLPNATFEFIYTGTTWQVTSTIGPRGEFGYTGSQGVQGSVGYTGSAGSQGTTGAAGIQGDTGATGATGPIGATGAIGATGLQGDTGATGVQGNTGATGATGPIGATGDTGYVGSQGATGAQGASLTLKGSVATVAALPATGNLINDAYIVDDEGNLYVWNGTAWFDAGQIVGPTGPQGIQGTTGYVGSIGATGLQGDVGATGPQGNVGATGPQGYAGSVGSQGNIGYTGSLGYTGSAGVFSGNTNSAVNINNSTASTSVTTGALTVAGGVGVSGNIVATSVYTESLFYANGTPFVPAIVGMSNMLYVAKNGNDSNNGTINAPKLTIKAALAAAVSGNTVFVAPGSYTENNPVTIPAGVSLKGDDLRSVTIIPQTPASDLFYVKNASYVWGVTIKDYAANGFAYDPATASQNVFVSPYVQNVTSTTTAATATAVKIDGNLVSAISTKAMILGFFTIINRGGKGVHLVNQAYSQAVNIYTIATDVGILAESGSFVTLNGSDNSIGNYGLKAIGKGPEALTGTTFGTSIAGVFQIRGLASQPKVNQTMTIDGDANYYGIDTVAQIDSLTWEVTVQEVYTDTLVTGTTVRFFQRSAIIASAHTFEYVGAGTNPATALPQYGGIPIEANEVIQADGGRVTFTSTDHKGNFKIGANLVINQATGIINGDSFNRSMFALMTPYILALEG